MRRPLALATCALAILVFAPVPVHAQQAEAQVEKSGWWNRSVGSSDDAGPGFGLPTAPTVPSDAIAVGATRGVPDKVAAVGFLLDVASGARVSELALVLQQVDAPGANIQEEDAVVAACPITTFWGPAHNGAWDQRPAADCSLGRAVGERSEGGSWFFDLTPMAGLWLGGDPIDQNGVLLFADTAEGGQDVQVSFRDDTTGGIFVSLEASTSPRPAPSAAPPPPAVGPGPGFAPPVSTRPSLSPVATPAPTATAEPAVIVAEPAQSTGELREPDILGGLPWATAVLVPLVLALAVALSYSLGPAGDPESGSHRQGAVSRTLARRSSDDRAEAVRP